RADRPGAARTGGRRCAGRLRAAGGRVGTGDRGDRAGDRGAPPRAWRHRQVAAARRLTGHRPGVAAAAFFDLDRTLLRRSSALALAGSFRERGLISRWQMLRAAGWQLLFVARGASHESVRRAAEDGLHLLAGYTPEQLRELVAEAMEPILRPLVYAEPLHL